jgi:hypothetical protein
MGLYDNASKHVNIGSNLYVKVEPGSKVRIRIIDHPYVSTRQFQAGGDLTTRFSWPVWDYESEKVKILEQGPAVFRMISDIVAEYGEEVPMECDLVIGRTGEGLNTRYSVVPGKIQSDLPKDIHEQLPVMKDVVKGGIPLKDFGEGKKPEPRGADGADGEEGYQSEQVPIEAYEEG